MNQEKKPSLYYYFTYIFFPKFCFEHYATFKSFQEIGPKYFSEILIGMCKGLKNAYPNRFTNMDFFENESFEFFVPESDNEKIMFLIRGPLPKIVPEPIEICIVMYNDKPRYFVLESDDSHIVRMNMGFPKEECVLVAFVSEWFKDGSHKNLGQLNYDGSLTANFLNKIKQECNFI